MWSNPFLRITPAEHYAEYGKGANTMKKFLSMIMAAALVFALAVPAFAAGTDMVVSGKVTEPTIAVSVPKLSIVLNPYHLTLKDANKEDTQAPIIAAPIAITSTSNVPIKYTFKATKGANTTEGIMFATTDIANDTAKKVKVNLAFAVSEDPKTAPDSWTYNVDVPDGESGVSIPDGQKATAIIPIPTSDHKTTALWVNVTGVTSKGDTTPTAEGTDNANKWVKTDTVEVNIAFTFIPEIAPANA
jgi:hypothetical protein